MANGLYPQISQRNGRTFECQVPILGRPGGSRVDLARIEELIELMRRSRVMELSLELPDYKIRIKRAGDGEAAPPTSVVATGAAPALPADVSAAAPLSVPSPVVGVFRSSTLKGRKPVAVGDRVARGSLLATVEAMKVPNEVRSPVEGVVMAVLAEEGQPVEFGQALFTLLPEEGGGVDESETTVGVA